ncbi:MAG: hypothetical protein A4E65_00216 [Syntrophorhabdus sp. PtaU1.Bin153]|nr:MAG: hypothetical protein A4E65_00216 [Syntrophorhabdus sp. PtaU1.Bin153]
MILRVNYFGWRGQEALIYPEELGCDIIEDHTHDPDGIWSQKSKATFCCASLRKTHPMPVGGAAWSPVGFSLSAPSPPSRACLISSEAKLAGMILKQAYLLGAPINKEEFRAFLSRGEAGLADEYVSDISKISSTLLSLISPWCLRKKRDENFQALIHSGHIPEEFIAKKSLPTGCVPFSLVLLLPSESERDRVKRKLIENRVYPAVLWPVSSSTDRCSADFSSRMLSLPCDYRYAEPDIFRLLSIMKKVFVT